MNEEILEQILEEKKEQEKLKEDLNGLDFRANADACKKFGEQ